MGRCLPYKEVEIEGRRYQVPRYIQVKRMDRAWAVRVPGFPVAYFGWAHGGPGPALGAAAEHLRRLGQSLPGGWLPANLSLAERRDKVVSTGIPGVTVTLIPAGAQRRRTAAYAVKVHMGVVGDPHNPPRCVTKSGPQWDEKGLQDAIEWGREKRLEYIASLDDPL